MVLLTFLHQNLNVYENIYHREQTSLLRDSKLSFNQLNK